MVVAYGRLVRRSVLERLPMVNLHFSLLPRWRGAAPVERALLAGDRETGVCLMQLEEGLDTGPVFARRAVAIGAAHDGRPSSGASWSTSGTELLVSIAAAGGCRILSRKQGEPTYAAKLDPAELELDWGRPAAELDRIVRVGGAWTTWRGRRLKVVSAEPVAAGGPLGPGVLDGTEVGTRRRVAPPAHGATRGQGGR